MATVGDVQHQWSRVQDATSGGIVSDWWEVEVRAMRWGGQPELVFPAIIGIEGMADITAVVFGVFAILLAVTIALVLRIIGFSLSWVPVVGGAISSGLADAAGWVWNTFSGWAHAAMEVVVTLAKWTWAVLRAIPGLSVHFFGVMFDQMALVQDHLVPNVLGQALNAANAVQHYCVGVAQSLYNQAVGYAHAVASDAMNLAYSLYHAAVAEAQQLAGAVAAEAQQLFNVARADIATAEAAAIHQAQLLAGAVEADAQALYRAGQQALDQAVHGIDAELGRVEQSLADILGTQLPALVRLLSGEIAGVASAAAAATAAVAVDFADWQRNCGNNLCGGLLNDAKQALQLEQLVVDGAVFGFLAAAIRDPEPVADGAVDLVGPFTDTVGTLLDELVGWAA